MISNLYAPLGAADRLATIATYDLVNPELRKRLDHACADTCTRVGWPTAMVTIVLDTGHFIAGAHGRATPTSSEEAIPEGITPIAWSVCAYTVLGGVAYRVRDVARHPAHRDNASLPRQGIGSYAGVPLMVAGGEVIGAHCVVDGSPREMDGSGLAALRSSAAEIDRIIAAYRI